MIYYDEEEARAKLAAPPKFIAKLIFAPTRSYDLSLGGLKGDIWSTDTLQILLQWVNTLLKNFNRYQICYSPKWEENYVSATNVSFTSFGVQDMQLKKSVKSLECFLQAKMMMTSAL